MRARTFFGLLIAALLVLGICEGQAWGQIIVKVDCNKRETITQALQGFEGSAITIQVKGTCNENVDIARDDVTLKGVNPSATVNGSDPNKNTINVRAARVTIDGLTVTGGWHGVGIYENGIATIRNCTVKNAVYKGINFYQRGRGSVDNCTVQNNGHHGIAIEASDAKVINSTISLNSGAGVHVIRGSSARIGMNDVVGEPVTAGNTISKNQGPGININFSSHAYIAANTIKENGTNPQSVYGQAGINVSSATATLWGSNTIINNKGPGVSASLSSGVGIGGAGAGVPTRNTITGNGLGVAGNNGAHLYIFDADISNNMGNGVGLWLNSSANINASTVNNNAGQGVFLGLRSSANINATTVNYNQSHGVCLGPGPSATAVINGGTINGNQGDGVALHIDSTAVINGGTINNNNYNGIRLIQGAGLILGNPAVTVTGNTFWGLQCLGDQSRYTGNITGISWNTGGDVSPDCTEF